MLAIAKRHSVELICGAALALELCACKSLADRDGEGSNVVQEAAAGGAGALAQAASGGVSGGDAGNAVGAGSAGQRGYRVELRADRASLCEGECTRLSVTVEGATPPVDYAWSDADLLGAGPLEVCPAQTTTYEVVATDSWSSLEEFGGGDHEASDALEISVSSSCDADAGVDEPGLPLRVLCELRIPSLAPGGLTTASPFSSDGNIVSDAQGNAYLVGTFHGAIEVGDLTLQSTDPESPSGFLLKVSSTCEPLLLKAFDALQTEVVLNALALSSQGEIFVGGYFRGRADFGRGELFSDTESGLVMKLDASGEVVWNELFNTADVIAYVEDLSTTRDDDLLIAGATAGGMPVFGTLLNAPYGQRAFFVARVSSAGDLRWLQAVEGGVSNLVLEKPSSGSIAFAGTAWPTPPLAVAGYPIDLGPTPGPRMTFMGMLESDGSVLWGRVIRAFADQDVSFWGVALSADSADNPVLDEGATWSSSGADSNTQPDLMKLDGPSGTELWSQRRPFGRSDSNNWNAGIALDSQDNILHVDEVLAGAMLEDGTLVTVEGASDFVIQKRDPSGTLLSWQKLGGPLGEWCWGLAIGAEDSAWVGWGQLIDEATFNNELVITRLSR